jgi:hypothetical protein
MMLSLKLFGVFQIGPESGHFHACCHATLYLIRYMNSFCPTTIERLLLLYNKLMS